MKTLDIVWLEDDLEFLRFATGVLESGARGIEEAMAFEPSVRHVATLAQAVREIESSPPELIITDLRLSDSQGSATVAALRAVAAATPILVLSGTENLEPGMTAAMHDAEFLDKDDLNPQRLWRSIYMAIMRTSVHPARPR